MNYNGTIDIAVGMSARSKLWKNKEYQWSDLATILATEHKTNETFKEYINASKDEQAKIKDVGGFVGGYLRGGRRKPENVVHRQLITLDIDFAHADFWDDFCMQFNNAAVLHGTHKYTEENPRFRLVLPLSREVTSDEYVAIARKVAGTLNIELFDNTTFEPNRLMYWPSSPKDIDYYVRTQDGPWLDADAILDSYADWKDSSLWPTADKQFQVIKSNLEKVQDPQQKKGVVGAFCRTFSISEAIDKYLADVYTPTTDGRYTYAKGTTASGMIVYDDKFAFSHHGTDPSNGKLCNSFDLVRLHKFGHLDKDQTEGDKAKSYSAMVEFARGEKEVKKIIAEENLAETKYDFAEDIEEGHHETAGSKFSDVKTKKTNNKVEINIEWMSELEIDSKGKYLSSATNINLIFTKDQRLQGLFKRNLFDGKNYIFRTAPWRKIKKPEPIKNIDYSGVRNYFESIYEIVGALKVEDAMALEIDKNSFHPVKEYLNSLSWDGNKRVDNLLIDYFGAENNIYSREAIRKMLVGAVARIYRPGVKFDLVLTLVGTQGTGKSTFLKKLGLDWFSDTFMSVHGKDALEQIQGCWLIEMAELAGLRKSDVEAVKHFITKQVDNFRPAYGRTAETYERQCVFFGSTNNKDFLRDPSGNRRFIPVDVNKSKVTKSIWSDLSSEEVDQIWAEAVEMYNAGEHLYMSAAAEAIANIEQRGHSEIDERKGIIEEYLDTLLPDNWSKLDLDERRMYLSDPKKKGTVERDYICIAEVWCECLGKEKENMDRYKTKEVNDVLRSLENWEQANSTKNFELYGKQRYYQRKLM